MKANDEIILINPTPEYAEDIMRFRDELFLTDSPDRFAGCSCLEDFDTAEEWLSYVEKLSSKETCPEGMVVSDTYIAVRKSDNKIVGITDLRHSLDTPKLKEWGGNIGYCVRPDERGKGYGTEMLRQNLENCRRLGLEEIMISSNDDNIPCKKIIAAHGGVYVRTVPVSYVKVEVFRITLKEKDPVVESYENYREEDRLSTNNARRIEFLTTVKILDETFKGDETILDCAAGTGIYSFYYADKGHKVTAADITPRHVEIIRETLKTKDYDMETAVLDASDMSIFADESFDAVLNMGPFYHIIDGEKREKCLRESVRVLKKGGLLITAYIPRFFVFRHVALQDEKYLDSALARQITETGILRHDDEKCFWTDTYYSTADEMEALYNSHGLTVTDHFAQDGITPMFAEKIDKLGEESFRVWCEYHYSTCRERSALGMSNHVVIIGRKNM